MGVSVCFQVLRAILLVGIGSLSILKAAFSFNVMHKFILDLRELFVLCLFFF